jgi:hypothetical protein
MFNYGKKIIVKNAVKRPHFSTSAMRTHITTIHAGGLGPCLSFRKNIRVNDCLSHTRGLETKFTFVGYGKRRKQHQYERGGILASIPNVGENLVYGVTWSIK